MAEAARSNTSIFQLSIETRLLYPRVAKMEAGETVLYNEFTSLIGSDVQRGGGYSALWSAREIALRDNDIVTKAIPNVGIKRLTDAEIANSGGETFARQRRLARRFVRKTATVDYANLSDTDKAALNAARSAQAVISLFAKPRTLDRITAANAVTGELPIARTLELFRGPKDN